MPEPAFTLRKRIGNTVRRLSLRLSARNRADALLAELHSVLPAPRERRFLAYGVGLPKSGTTSLGNVFAPAYRSTHEGRPIRTIPNILDWKAGRISGRALRQRLRYRDKRLGLEFEASHYLYLVVEQLVELFPQSKYVLTYRDPFTWLESQFNQRIVSPGAPWWTALAEHCYGRYDHCYEAPVLCRREGVYPVASCLCYWRDHLEHVIRTVPQERLLKVRTSELSDRFEEIARFVGADPARLNTERQHANRRREKPFQLFEVVKHEEVERQVEHYCGDLIEKHFPDLAAHL